MEKEMFEALMHFFEAITCMNRDEVDLLSTIRATLEEKMETINLYTLSLKKGNNVTHEQFDLAHKRCLEYYSLIIPTAKRNINIEFLYNLKQIYDFSKEKKENSVIASLFLHCADVVSLVMLHQAVEDSNKEKVRDIINTMQNPAVFINRVRDFLQKSSLHVAVQKFISLLAGYEKANDSTKLELHNQLKIIGLFMEKGGNFYSEDKQGNTCFNYFATKISKKEADVHSSKITEKLSFLVREVKKHHENQAFILAYTLQNETDYPIFPGENISKPTKNFVANHAISTKGKKWSQYVGQGKSPLSKDRSHTEEALHMR